MSQLPRVEGGAPDLSKERGDSLPEIASLLATGYLRLLLSCAGSAPTPNMGASCGAAESAPGANTPVEVLRGESVHCGDGRPDEERATGDAGRPVGADPVPEHRPASGRVPASSGAPDGLVESGVAAPQSELANPGERASKVRRRRSSDAGSGGPGRAEGSEAQRADSGPAGPRSPGSAPPEAGVGHSPRLPRPPANPDGPGARV